VRDVNEVLREKESAMERVAREVEILRLAIPLLTHENSNGAKPLEMRSMASIAAGRNGDVMPGDKLPGDVLPDDVFPGDVRPEDVRPGERRPGPGFPGRGDEGRGDEGRDDRPDVLPGEPGLDPLVAGPQQAASGDSGDEFEYRGFPVTESGVGFRRPSVLGLESETVEETDEVDGQRISSRLKRFTRPLVSFMAG
jgi:hypothetical protein